MEAHGSAARRSWRYLPPAAAFACLGAACMVPVDTIPSADDEALGVAESALDLACTADPTKGVPSVTGFVNAYHDATFNPNGVDLADLTAIGPTCGFGSQRDDNCCEATKLTNLAAYNTCKQQQEQNAKDFIEDFSRQMPLVPPADLDPPSGSGLQKVVFWQGYYYDWNSLHASVDLARETVASGTDPGFPVYAVGDGEVIFAGWDGAEGGNVIVVRHPLWNGSSYLSEYRHVRGGVSHDKQQFCPCINPAGVTEAARLLSCSATDKAKKECKYAAKLANDIYWGSSTDALPAPGTVVRLGEQIATAGNSGTVTDHINNDGTLSHPTGNTHLHFTLRVATGDNEGSAAVDYVALDAFGAYSKTTGVKNGLGCYDLDQSTPYPRLVTPFDPNDYIAMRNHPGLQCRQTGGDTTAVTYSSRGAVVNTATASEEVVCPAGRYDTGDGLSNYVFGRVWVNDQSTTGNVCCHVITKNPTGTLREAPEECSSGTGAQVIMLDFPKMHDPFSWSHFDISCTLPASSGGASSSIHTYRVQQQRF
ncbi:uncharacterized protein SOCE26_069110 [Sorangium cellulosum]|uniref:Peptidase M23 domain-containing protein n=1 Tax=Sorangium cellulosum TaxID=56 RepID=A0A2L0F1J2_SORCE|nr:M23 family metallopeptidase [Sorangium cellulosum]AUX45420.1 uncharacterized protein SOCE26_069110 [Sorangium cellulosum]